MKSLVYVTDPPQYPIKGVDTKLAIHSETVNIEPCSTGLLSLMITLSFYCEYMYYNYIQCAVVLSVDMLVQISDLGMLRISLILATTGICHNIS